MNIGNIYVVDSAANNIRKMNATGTLIATLGDGLLNHPQRMALDSAGNIYVANTDI